MIEDYKALIEALDEGALDVAAIARERILERQRIRADVAQEDAIREFRARLLGAALIAAMFDEIERMSEDE